MKPKQKSINERIAVEVMGWKYELRRSYASFPGQDCWVWVKGSSVESVKLPDWSGNLNLAMGLLEGKTWVMSNNPIEVTIIQNDPETQTAPSFPEAICLAVLDWNKKNPKSPTKSQSKGTIVGRVRTPEMIKSKQQVVTPKKS